MSKPRVIKDFEKVSPEMLEQIKLTYPTGFRRHLIEFTGIDGKKRKGLPFETEEYFYLIRMTEEKAIFVIKEDNDYDDKGNLKSDVQSHLADKYDDSIQELGETDDIEDLGFDDDVED